MVALPHRLLRRADLAPDPIEQFQRWYGEWAAEPHRNPDAVVLATASATGQPSARYVLLRRLDERGFVFFTNYRSPKGEDLASNPRAALCFGWLDHERQVRVTGRCSKIAAEESDAYWVTRPPQSQLAASVSEQSRPIADRAALDARYEEARAAAGDEAVPRPAHWGGYRVVPDEVEFWQGQPYRLHDRFVYRRAAGSEGLGGGCWVIERLMP